MIGFYKKNISYLTEAAVNPDRRRYAVLDEAPRHFIDLDEYKMNTAPRSIYIKHNLLPQLIWV